MQLNDTTNTINISMANPPNTQTPPDENKLRLVLANGPDFVQIAQQMIDAFKLQYVIEINPTTGIGTLKDALKGTDLHLKYFITADPDTLKMKEDIHKLAKCDYPILITGETGTGKEILAKAMIGDRTGNTVFINCAGLPETLIESELFGYVKGSFTGAVGDKQGLLARAKNGVAFLDEIGELPISMQAKLLRAIQEKRVRRVGGTDEEEITCKIVCATNRSLPLMVEQEKFRQDLYARIGTFEVHVKPLRERMCDVVPIIQSMKSGQGFLNALVAVGKHHSALNLRHNVRSLQQYVNRFEVLGRVVL